MAQGTGTRWASILWFVAAGLALAAAGVTYGRGGGIKWTLLAAAAFLVAMGFAALKRSKAGGV